MGLTFGKYYKILGLIFWLNILTVASTYSQEIYQPQYKNYTLPEGLPQMQVTTLFQDSRGYIWVGTKDGVARYNGENFKTFKDYYGKKSYIFAIKEDRTKRMVVAFNRSISYIDGDSIKGYFFDKSIQYIEDLEIDKNNLVWILAKTYSDKFVIGFLRDGKFNKFSLTENMGNIEYDPVSDRIIFRTSKAVCSIDHQGKVRELFKISDKYLFTGIKILNQHIYAILTLNKKIKNDAEANLFFYRIGNTSNTFDAIYQHGKWSKDTAPSIRDKISVSFRYPSHSLFIIEKGEVKKYDISQETIITSYLMDRDGTVWLGSEHGLYKMLPNGIRNFKPDFLQNVWSVIEQPQGVYWLTSYDKGLTRLENNKATEIPTYTKTGDKTFFYFKGCVNKQGDVFLPYQVGAYVLSHKGRKHDFVIESQSPKYTNNVCFFMYYEPKEDKVYIAKSGRIEVYNGSGKLLDIIDETEDGQPILGNILHICPDKNNNLWFGGWNIYRYNLSKKTVTKMADENTHARSISAVTDYKGRTWFASTKGLMYCDENSREISFLENDDIFKESTSFVTTIDSTHLLLGQLHGLYIMDLKEYYTSGKLNLSLYNQENGYFGIEPGQDGAFTDSQGRVWITSGSCLSYIDPKLLSTKSSVGSVYFTSCNKTPVLYTANRVQLAHNSNNAIVTFEAVSFSRPLPVQFSYKVGAEGDWSKWQTEDYIVLNGLKHGNTKLFIRAKFSGVPNMEYAEQCLIITANLAIYKQSWFVPAIITLLLVILLVAFTLFSHARMRLSRASQEVKSLEVSAIQSQLNPHFIFNVLALVQNKIQNNEREVADKQIAKLAFVIRQFLNITIDDRGLKSENGDITKDSHEDFVHLIPIEYELEALKHYIEFYQSMFPNAFNYIIEITPNTHVEKILIPPLLLQLYIENAITHGLITRQDSNGVLKVIVDLQSSEKMLLITIEDNGIGIEASQEIRKKEAFRFPPLGGKMMNRRFELLRALKCDIHVTMESSDKGTKVVIKYKNPKYKL